MPTDVARLDLRLRRRAMLGYAAGMAAYVLIVVALYPAFKDQTGLDELTRKGSAVAALFGASGPLTTPSGWLDANVYANFLPLVVLLLTVGYGAAAVAGQDEAGTLALVTTLPVSRRAVLAQKIAVLVALTIPVGVVTFALALAGRRFDLDLGAAPLAGVTVGALLLGIDLGLLALLVGALTGSRGTALGVASAVAAAAYLVSALAPVSDVVRPLRYASPFYWAVGNGQTRAGLGLGAAAVLVGTAVVLGAAATLAFDRLDVH